MATGIGYMQHLIPVKGAFVNSADTDFQTEFVDLLDFIDFEFLIQCGTIASSAGSGTWVITPYVSSTVTAAGDALTSFVYRCSTTGVGSDEWSAAVSTDTSITVTSDNSDGVILVAIDPQAVAAAGSDKRYVYLSFDVASDDNSTGYWAVTGIGRPRHAQATMKGTTA